MISKIVNKAFFAVYYCNREGSNYDINDAKQRDAARSNFGHRQNLDSDIFKAAVNDYLETCRSELEKLLPVECGEVLETV